MQQSEQALAELRTRAARAGCVHALCHGTGRAAAGTCDLTTLFEAPPLALCMRHFAAQNAAAMDPGMKQLCTSVEAQWSGMAAQAASLRAAAVQALQMEGAIGL